MTWRTHWGRFPERSPQSSPVPERRTLLWAKVRHSSPDLAKWSSDLLGRRLIFLTLSAPRYRAGLVQWREEEDRGELLHSGAVCAHSLLSQQWTKPADTLAASHSIQLWSCGVRGLSARGPLLQLSARHGFSTPGPWEDVASWTDVISLTLGRHSPAAKPLSGDGRQLGRNGNQVTKRWSVILQINLNQTGLEL